MKTLELVVFTLRDGVGRDQFLPTVEPVSAWIGEQPGFISRELSYDSHADRWIEVVWWETREAAEAAAELALTSETCAPMFAAIEMDDLLMAHGQLVASHGA
jgi:hypothetical protein